MVGGRRHSRSFAPALLVGAAGLALAFGQTAHSKRRAAAPHDRPMPILMYHVISAPTAGNPNTQLFVRPADFAGEMKWLARKGYHGVTLRQVYDYWANGGALPRRPIVVSFDDGYLSVHTQALLVLSKLHWPGVLNLEVRHLRSVYNLPPWRVRDLIAAGWEIDAHTITHPDLTAVDDERLWHEVWGSRTAIRHEFHVAVDFFCYPAGRYDARVIAAVRRAGYLGATTTNYGLARPAELYVLRRIRVNGSDGVAGLARKLEGLLPAPY